MVSLVNSQSNASRIGYHLWEIDLRYALELSPGWLYNRVALQILCKNPWPLREGRAPTERPRDAVNLQNPLRRRHRCPGTRRHNLRCSPPWCSSSSFRASRPAPRTRLPPASPAALPRRWGVRAQGGSVYVYRVAGGRGSGAGRRKRRGRGLGRCGPQILTVQTWNVCVSLGTKMREEAEDLLSETNSCCCITGRCSAEQAGVRAADIRGV